MKADPPPGVDPARSGQLDQQDYEVTRLVPGRLVEVTTTLQSRRT